MDCISHCIYNQLSIFEIFDYLATIPSPRHQFAIRISQISKLSLTTVLMMVSTTNCYLAPNMVAQQRIAKALSAPISELFPANKKCKGSLANMYRQKSSKKEELHSFINLISSICHRDYNTVMGWMKKRKLPHTINKEYLAKAIGIPVHKLFPNEMQSNQ